MHRYRKMEQVVVIEARPEAHLFSGHIMTSKIESEQTGNAGAGVPADAFDPSHSSQHSKPQGPDTDLNISTTSNMFPSKNAVTQALHLFRPDIKRTEFFKLIKTPMTFTSVMRYWHQTYNILPWKYRSSAEQAAAMGAAEVLINSADRS